MANVKSVELPEGFVLDGDISLPEGFELDEPRFGRLDPARIGFETAVKSALIPGFAGSASQRIIEKPEESLRATLAIKAPVASAIGFGARKLAETEKGKEIISRVQERQRAMTPTTFPGRLQQFAAERMPVGHFQEFGAGVTEATVFGISQAALRNTALGGNMIDIGKRLGKIKFFKNPDYVLSRSKEIGNISDDLEKQAGRAIGDLWDSPAGDKAVNIARTSKALEALPTRVIRKLKTVANQRIFKVRFLPDGTLDPKARNIWRLRRFLDDFLTRKDYIDAGKIEKQVIRTARNELATILREVDPRVAPIMDKYSNIEKIKAEVDPIVKNPRGNPIANKLQNLFTSKGEPGIREFFKRLAELSPRVTDIIRDIEGFNIAQGIKRGFLGTLGTVGRFAAARKFLVDPILGDRGGEFGGFEGVQ